MRPDWNAERQKLYDDCGAVRVGWSTGLIMLWSLTSPCPGPEWFPVYFFPVGEAC